MNRIDRLHAILTHLQSKKLVTAQQIAERFHISLRTVYRDIKALEESGVPVLGEAGHGYSVMEGYRLPPVMFTQEEASALLFSSKLAEQLTDSSVRKHLDAALFKIKAVLRTCDKEHLENLDSRIQVFRYQGQMNDEDSHSLTVLQKALADQKTVRLEYFSAYNESKTTRIVEPTGLCYYGMNWHLIAWCRLRSDYRDFKLSNINSLQIKDESYEHKDHQSLTEYIQRFTRQNELREIVVLFKKDVARFIGAQKYFNGFVSSETVGDKVRMIFLTSCVDSFCRWLLMYTNAVQIESPLELLNTMSHLSEKLVMHYQKAYAIV